MPVQSLEEWAGSRVQSHPLSALRNAVIGVDASHYLELRLNSPTSHEPLLNAIGGDPYTLEAALQDDLDAFRAVDAKLLFVFDGLDHQKREPHDSPSVKSTLKAHRDGWEEYTNGANGKKLAADRTLKAFAKAKYPLGKVERYFQYLLKRHSVSFMVAPYSAVAQLAYLERGLVQVKQESTQFIDVIISSPDPFLFGVERVIINFSTQQGSGRFDSLSRSACQERLEKISEDVFRDVQLLLGGAFLPTFPPLDKAGGGKVGAREALSTLNAAGRSVAQLCQQWRENPQVRELDYEDRYKRAVLSLRHHVVLNKEGKATSIGPEYEAGDAHEFIGLRLPEELYFYLSRAMLGPRIPSWMASGEIDLTLPVGCEDTEDFRHLVGAQLTSLRAQSVCLLSNSLNRFYQTRSIKVNTWYLKGPSKIINVKDEPSVKNKLAGWKVPEAAWSEHFQEQGNKALSFARFVRSLEDPKVGPAAASKSGPGPLKTKAEIVFNVMARFLQLRGFVDEQRRLTVWGKALGKAFSSLDSSPKLEESVYLAMEMLRLDLLDDDSVGSKSENTKTEDAAFSKRLVTRVACFGRLKHRSIGYSGPLDRELLNFQFKINAVRTSLRDLLETVLVSMCLNGEIDRNRNDWSNIVLSLPLLRDHGAGLAIAVSTYFDDVNRHGKKKDEKTPSESTKEEVKSNFGWLPQVPNITRNLKIAFTLWDAVYVGCEELGKDVKDAKTFATANTWLSSMR